ncbi:MAG: hypothetical protein K8R60_09505 [Burkholderiales bacterium]|nr:hypothetical protein [Burkholderiales bacterium]
MPACLRFLSLHRPLAAVVIGCSLAGATLAAPGGAAGPASNPSRSTSMATNAADGAFTPVQLKNLVGERIGPWKQAGLDVKGERRDVQQTTLVYGFRNGKEKATLTVSDLGTENNAPGPAHWTGPPNRRETPTGAEYVYREGRATVREIERRTPPAREVVVLLANGIMVSAAGDADMKVLKALADGVSVAAAEALVRPAK